LSKHPVPYPNYRLAGAKQLRSVLSVIVVGIPVTIFVNTRGKVVKVHLGPYHSQSVLSKDILHLIRLSKHQG